MALTWAKPAPGSKGWPGEEDPSLLPDLVDRLMRCLNGQAVDFFDVPTPPGAPFQRRCWEACRTIPRGETRSYAELAILAGAAASSARPAGQAMRNNPLPIIVPCHRVIASSGRLHGFGGSCDGNSPELALKRRLLALEGSTCGTVAPGAGT